MAKNRKDPALANLSKLFKKGTAKHGTVSLPDGTYQAKIIDAKRTLTQKKKLQIDWTFEVISGEYEGRKQHKYDLLVTQDNVDWLLGTLETLEIEMPKKFNEDNFAEVIDSCLKKAVGLVAEVSIRTSGDFSNVYINELLEGEGDDGNEDEDEEDEDEADESDESDESDEDTDDEEEDEDEDEGEDDEDELEVGSRVLVTIDDEEYPGEIASINSKKGTAKVNCDDGDTVTAKLDELKAE